MEKEPFLGKISFVFNKIFKNGLVSIISSM